MSNKDQEVVEYAEETRPEALSEELDAELEAFESEDVEITESLEDNQVISVLESVLFATDKPQSVAVMKQAFRGTDVNSQRICESLETLKAQYASLDRGITLEEVSGGYQLRTKVDNMKYMRNMIKGRSFKLSGPALEVLSILAYKQPCIKADIDEIRGVESGHLLRGLMERSLVSFEGKSELPGKPMLYGTTKKFLETFGLRNIKELPSLDEIDELIPEGIGDELEEDQTLGQLTDGLSQEVKETYSEGEDELMKITDQLSNISTRSEFFEQEKARIKAKKESEKAQDIEDALAVGEDVSSRNLKWLERYKAKLAETEELATDVDKAHSDQSNNREESVLADIKEPYYSDQERDKEKLDVFMREGDGESDIGHSAQSDSDKESVLTDLDEALKSFDQKTEKTENLHSTQSDGKNADTKIGDVSLEQLEKDLEIFAENPSSIDVSLGDDENNT